MKKTNYIERKEEFEKFSHLKVIKPINNYRNCIIINSAGNFILARVYENTISIGSGIIKEFKKIEDLEKLNDKQIKEIEMFSKI